jgi:uncharacterized protein
MEKNNIIASSILGVLLAIGLIFGGCYIGKGWIKAKTAGRFVRVDVAVERIVQADFSTWRINIQSDGPDLQSATRKLEKDRSKLIGFLSENSFKEEEIENDQFRVYDSLANGQGKATPAQINSRYKVSQVIAVRTSDVMKVYQAYQKITDLLKEGVMVNSGRQFYSSGGPQYELLSYDDVKVEMLEEVVQSARKSAEVFAADSDSEVGKIKSATQAKFRVQTLETNNPRGLLRASAVAAPNNEPSSIKKKVTVSVTQEYYLED